MSWKQKAGVLGGAGLVALLMASPEFASGGTAIPLNTLNVSSVAVLRTLPVATGLTSPNVWVRGYYGANNNCPIQYSWNSGDSSSDNAGTIINPTGNAGNGRWNAVLPAGPVHSCVFGVKVDSIASGAITTDNSIQLQRLLTWAHASGSNWVHLDSKPGFCIGLTTTLVPLEAEIVEGDGEEQLGGALVNTCLDYPTLAGGYVFSSLTPFPGSGTVPFEAPKYRDLIINLGASNANPGGCVQWNQIAGGFTDDSTSQQPQIHPQLRNVVCNMGIITGNQQIGFQCSKCFDGHFQQSDATNGDIGYDIEGSDNIVIDGGCRVSGTRDEMVLFQARSTFGNIDKLSDCELIAFHDSGDSHNIDSFVYDAARSSTISNISTEGNANAGGTLGSQIHLAGGFIATVTGNVVTGGTTATPWLRVDTAYTSITALNNSSNGALIGPASFTNASSTYFYSPSVRQVLTHSGNGLNGDLGWPFNTTPIGHTFLYTKVEESWTPSFDGMTVGGDGLIIVNVANEWVLSNLGSNSTHYLLLARNLPATVIGAFDATIRAYQTGAATGNVTCQLTDNGALVGAPITQAITNKSSVYVLGFNQAIATDVGVICWDPTTVGVHIAQVNVQDH